MDISYFRNIRALINCMAVFLRKDNTESVHCGHKSFTLLHS